MSDWYDEELNNVQQEAAEAAGITVAQVVAVYGFLSELGLIDYDTEKEIFWDRREERDEEDDE